MMSTTTTAPYSNMRAVVFESYGKPCTQHIKLTTVPAPSVAEPTDVLIRVCSAALNPIDAKIVEGHMKQLMPLTLPHALGYDVAGIVEQVGSAVMRFRPGDAVYGRVDHHRLGTVADRCITSEQSLALKPPSLSFDEAAALPLVTLTALQSLRDVGKLSPGQKVLILGGSGGVGTAAIQIARILGAAEITVTQRDGFNQSLQLGATRVVDYTKESFNKVVRDQDLVFDTTGEANSSFACLRSNGTTVSIIGAILPQACKDAGMELSTTTSAFLTAAAAPTVANALAHNVNYKFAWMRPDGRELEEVSQWVADGKLRPVLDRVYKLEDFAAAFDRLDHGHPKGKIVLHIAD